MRVPLHIAFILLFPFLSSAQNWELGVTLGASNYLGDIGSGKGSERPFVLDLQERYTKACLGLYGRYYTNGNLAFRANLIYGQLSGDDKLVDYWPRRLRNLSFRTNILELSGQVEYNFLSSKNVRYRELSQNFRRTIVIAERSLYAFVGVGVFHFNPTAELDGVRYNLQTFGTEGQVDECPPNDATCTEKYNRVAINIPMGLGIQYLVDKEYRVGFEIGWRKLFTDYIDDISNVYADPNLIAQNNGNGDDGATAVALAQRCHEVTNENFWLLQCGEGSIRGHGYHLDSYFFTVITVGYMIKTAGIDCPKYEKDRFHLF
ncbi:MAG: hypothetical protein IIA45_00415 [Bacteroidetes bacterium]|nr:hypothetical protein [Bacteroidota bacterium]